MTSVHAHLTEALEAVRAEADGLCFANCTRESNCPACRVTEIAACALRGDGWSPRRREEFEAASEGSP
jgi:hypothetical protein